MLRSRPSQSNRSACIRALEGHVGSAGHTLRRTDIRPTRCHFLRGTDHSGAASQRPGSVAVVCPQSQCVSSQRCCIQLSPNPGRSALAFSFGHGAGELGGRGLLPGFWSMSSRDFLRSRQSPPPISTHGSRLKDAKRASLSLRRMRSLSNMPGSCARVTGEFATYCPCPGSRERAGEWLLIQSASQ